MSSPSNRAPYRSDGRVSKGERPQVKFLVLRLLFPLLPIFAVELVVTTCLTPSMAEGTVGQPRDGAHATQVKALDSHVTERKRETRFLNRLSAVGNQQNC